jgi:hypothetical protein
VVISMQTAKSDVQIESAVSTGALIEYTMTM